MIEGSAGAAERAHSHLAARSWPEAGDVSLLAVPLGSTEQHGHHLPLDTDTRIAAALAARLAERVPGVVVAPPLPYGASGEHETFPGTLSLGQAALEHALVELVRSATRSIARVLLVNGHGGNAEPLARAVATLRREGRDVRAWHPAAGGDAHAGRTETSLMLALAPELVRLEVAEAGNSAPLSELVDDVRAGSVRAVSANGVLGDPDGAGAEEGHALLARLSDDLVATVTAWTAE